ncbi:MAG: hypothetical protein ABI158_06170 [Edaphobacter sp.]
MRTLPVVALLVASFGSAQIVSASGSASTVEDVLHQMSNQAEVIFTGQVEAIRPHDDEGAASGFIEIDFRVDQAIRGCASGTYVLREWAGLWSGNAHRYQVGQRLLMLLHKPGASGMSSPVGGLDGAIPILGGGAAALLVNASTPSQTPIVDLRWLGAKLLHPASYTLHSAISPTPLTVSQQIAAGSAQSPASGSITDPIATEDSSSRTSVPVQQASVDTVVQLLASWQKASSDVR